MRFASRLNKTFHLETSKTTMQPHPDPTPKRKILIEKAKDYSNGDRLNEIANLCAMTNAKKIRLSKNFGANPNTHPDPPQASFTKKKFSIRTNTQGNPNGPPSLTP
jgi:hypothetical protein